MTGRTLGAAQVRALIATAAAHDGGEATIGVVHLRPHQVAAVSRLRAMLARDGGALLADETGLGKTYVALALARDARSPLIVAPAALRPMWSRAADAADSTPSFTSYERLSRGAMTGGDHDMVILDEAHHARNPAARRYRAIAELTTGARVLLLSATPVHNRRRDLEALLALFLGARAATMTDAELGRHVLRRERGAMPRAERPPRVAPPVRLPLPHDDSLLEALIALPPPLPPSDGGDGGALLLHSLVRQWASSDGALRAALDRRAARAIALIDALAAGRYPTRSELRQWSLGDGAVQLAFPELMASAATDGGTVLLHAVERHLEAVQRLRRDLGARSDLDARRAGLVRDIRGRHPGAKVVAFTSYSDTASTLFRQLRADAGVAMLTAQGGRVAGGVLSRREAIERFAPAAQGVRPPSAAERIDLLIATDLLSEGMNLQDASVVIHLDLPWTPARLEQRVGRAARLGSSHHAVAVYALDPPASAERLIAVERRLREKLAVARRTVGAPAAVLPPLFAVPGTDDGSPAVEQARQRIARWGWTPVPGNAGSGAVAAVRAPDDGAIAAIEADGVPVIVAVHCGIASDEPAAVADLSAMAEGEDCEPDPRALARTRRAIDAWLADRRGATAAGVGRTQPLRRRIVARIADIARHAPVHRRPVVAALAAAAREGASAPLGAGAELHLAELASASVADEAWLAAVARFSPSTGPPPPETVRIVAILLLQR